MSWAMIAVMVALLLIAVEVLAQWFLSGIVLKVFERQLPLKVLPTEPHLTAERFSFPTTDGLQLHGSLYHQTGRPSRGLILFCPELNGEHWSVVNYCSSLWEAGFTVLSFDFRNHGSSDSLPNYQPLHWVTDYEVNDALSAIAYAKSRDDLRGLSMGIMGVSRGGGVALAAAAKTPDVRCVAVEGAFPTNELLSHYSFLWASVYVPQWVVGTLPLWHSEATLRLARWRSERRRKCHYTRFRRLLPRLRNRDVLMITGLSDSYVPSQITEAMAERVGGERCQLWAIRKARHNRARKVNPVLYDERLLEFFACLDGSPQSVNTTETTDETDSVCEPADILSRLN